MLDRFGSPVAADEAASIEAWNAAWGQALHFVDDPFVTLGAAEGDDAFAMGAIFCGTYRLLGGARPDSQEVRRDLERAEATATAPREAAHLEALRLFVDGEFTAAALRWDAISRVERDFAALRFAHDIYLHVGNVDDRVESSAIAVDQFASQPGWNFVASQHAFSLEEARRFDEAESIGWAALDADPMDLWATHALAHVYESLESHDAAVELLRGRAGTWSEQDGLAVHIWWHLALRLIAAGAYDEVLAIHDDLVPVATTPFRLCDLASMLWRLELVGVDVGSRWQHVADAYADRPERHTSGFLDLHMALAYTRCPDHPTADEFFAGVDTSHESGTSENDETFRSVVAPLVTAIRDGVATSEAAIRQLDFLEPELHRIGGSIAQRDLVQLTRDNYARPGPEAT